MGENVARNLTIPPILYYRTALFPHNLQLSDLELLMEDLETSNLVSREYPITPPPPAKKLELHLEDFVWCVETTAIVYRLVQFVLFILIIRVFPILF